MILTIGMIVKNEEKHLRSCLEAIAPLLKQVDSELIIADTGSTDSTVEIAKAFTDQVFHFEWCDDFSAARNSTLERAKGEWFMSLDADEIFEDVSGIIDFFNSGEYKAYRSATYTVRNFNSQNRAIYGDFQAYRLTKISADTRYRNRIHEYLPQVAPVKKLPVIAWHYGYVTEDNEETIEKKSQRNLKLLLLELEKDPYNCRYYLEAGHAHSMAGNTKAALKYFKKGLQYAKQQNHELLNPLYADTARTLCATEKYADTLTVVNEYFCRKKSHSEIDLQMHFLQAKSFYELNRYKEAAAAYEKYIENYERYHKGGLQTKDSLHYVVHYTDQYSFRTACMSLARAYIGEKDYRSAGDCLRRIPVADFSDDEKSMKRRLALELLYMEETDDYGQLAALLDQLDENAFIMMQTLLESQLENKAINVLGSGPLTKEQAVRLFHAYADIAGTFASAVYKEELPTEESLLLLPIHLRAGWYCSLAEKCLDQGEKVRYVGYLKEVLRLLPEWKDIIQILLDDFQAKLDRSEKNTGLTEVEQYAAIIKKNISQLIAVGQHDQAMEILKSYEQLCPSDPEINAMKDQLQ